MNRSVQKPVEIQLASAAAGLTRLYVRPTEYSTLLQCVVCLRTFGVNAAALAGHAKMHARRGQAVLTWSRGFDHHYDYWRAP